MMLRLSSDTLERTGFFVSLAILAFLYGFAAREFGWFPSSLLDRAGRQVRAVSPFRESRHMQRRVYGWSGVQAPRPDEVQPGVTLIASLWEEYGWKPGLKLIDREGRVLHEWEIDPRVLFPGSPELGENLKDHHVHGTHLFPSGDVLATLEYVGTVRLDACGRVVWRVPRTHHSVSRADDGSFWISGRREAAGAGPSASPSFQGLDGPLYHPLLLHVSAQGKVLDRISVLEVLYANGLQRHLFKMHQMSEGDPVHLNDIEPLPDSLAAEYPLFEAGDLVVSLRHVDLVFVVDPDTEQVKWHEADLFHEQHDPDYVGDGWIGVFDNRTDRTDRGTVLGGSRVVAVQPHTDSTRVLFPTSRSEPFYTGAAGKWQRLANGNMLLLETQAGRIVEVAPDGSTVWEWAPDPYDSSTVPEVHGGTRYDLSPERISSWPCSPGDSAESARG